MGWRLWTADIFVGLPVVDRRHFCWAAGCGQLTFLLGWQLWTADIFVGLAVLEADISTGLVVELDGQLVNF